MLFALTEIARETDDDRVATADRARVFVARMLDTMAETRFFHGGSIRMLSSDSRSIAKIRILLLSDIANALFPLAWGKRPPGSCRGDESRYRTEAGKLRRLELTIYVFYFFILFFVPQGGEQFLLVFQAAEDGFPGGRVKGVRRVFSHLLETERDECRPAGERVGARA